MVWRASSTLRARVGYRIEVRASPAPGPRPGRAQVDELRALGSSVETIFPDSASEHLFGVNAMDVSLRPPAARAGYDRVEPLPIALRVLALTPSRSGDHRTFAATDSFWSSLSLSS